MHESAACAVLKARFEAAGFNIVENQMFDEDGIRFEIDGFDPERRVGYEYVSSDSGDGWDVDAAVVAALDERRRKGELFVLVVDEADALDEHALAQRADAFLAEVSARTSAAASSAAASSAAASSAAAKTPAAKKPAAKKPAAKKPAAKKPAAKKPAAKKPAAKKPGSKAKSKR